MRGKVVQREAPISTSLDHPRTCGEKTDVDGAQVSPAGSPPHMRGKASYLQ